MNLDESSATLVKSLLESNNPTYSNKFDLRNVESTKMQLEATAGVLNSMAANFSEDKLIHSSDGPGLHTVKQEIEDLAIRCKDIGITLNYIISEYEKSQGKREPHHSMDMHDGVGEDDGW